VVAVAATVALLAPASADAAVVDLVPGPPFPEDQTPTNSYSVRYVAGFNESNGQGENNRLRISSDRVGDDLRVTLSDPGAKVEARLGCVQVNSHTARCTASGDRFIEDVEVSLGFGNDTLETAYPDEFGQVPVQANGGVGNDALRGGPEFDDFDGGGAGRDRLLGGPGQDELSDGDRSGPLASFETKSDVLDGGAGEDKLSYAGRKRGVTVDLASDAPTGERGERDTAHGFESAVGGRGPDRLLGDYGDNVLDGGPGNDLLLGRGGEDRNLVYADWLYGGRGRDRLRGGNGGDFLTPGRGRDSLSCGNGSDQVHAPAAGEVVGHCERIDYHGEDADGDLDLVIAPHPQKVAARHVDFGIPCPSDSDGEPVRCSAKVELRKAFGKHRLLGRARFNRDLGESSGPVRIRLTRLGRRLIRRRHGVASTIRLRGYPLPVAWTIQLRRPPLIRL
jgi:Ca2+-binding RTX toxin-like protein